MIRLQLVQAGFHDTRAVAIFFTARLIGAAPSHEVPLTGRFVAAAEALRIGPVSRVTGDGAVVGR